MVCAHINSHHRGSSESSGDLMKALGPNGLADRRRGARRATVDPGLQALIGERVRAAFAGRRARKDETQQIAALASVIAGAMRNGKALQ